MIRARTIKARVTRGAGDWHALLNDANAHVETEDLEAFSAWRADASNRAEYERLDSISRAVRTLQDDPDIRLATAEALARGPERRRSAARLETPRARLFVGSLVAACAVIALTGGYLGLRPTYKTDIGQTFAARLSDDSRVTLDTDSQVRVRFSRGERRIELLRGRALFEVAHNTQRPFIVEADGTRVRATGTRFEVRKIGHDVRVALTQGSVEIVDKDAKATTWRLKPGQALALTPVAPATAKPSAIDIQTATSWTSGHLTLQDLPLDEAVAELNRYSRDKIVLGDGAPRSRRISGVFSAGDNDDFIAAVSSLYGLKATHRANGDIELQPAREPKA